MNSVDIFNKVKANLKREKGKIDDHLTKFDYLKNFGEIFGPLEYF